MYESFYGLSAKPFQLRPDPKFYFGSKSHKRAMAYLQYGLSQGEGFIVITGEVGAGKTTLVRNLFREFDNNNIIAAQVCNTHLSSEDTLKMVASGFGINTENTTKATLLTKIENFLRGCNQQGKRALLVVDEAQNLNMQTIEELRMLSNFQTHDNSLLQTFLLGQPEFRKTLMSPQMLQLRQRVIATYHLGPMDASETRDYIVHRLTTAGWRKDPRLKDNAFSAIHDFTGGIPRRINTLCDRLFLLGFLEDIHEFTAKHVKDVIADIEKEFAPTSFDAESLSLPVAVAPNAPEVLSGLEYVTERLAKLERATQLMIDALSKLATSSERNAQRETKQ